MKLFCFVEYTLALNSLRKCNSYLQKKLILILFPPRFYESAHINETVYESAHIKQKFKFSNILYSVMKKKYTVFLLWSL